MYEDIVNENTQNLNIFVKMGYNFDEKRASSY
jgi:hypothetical protein